MWLYSQFVLLTTKRCYKIMPTYFHTVNQSLSFTNQGYGVDVVRDRLILELTLDFSVVIKILLKNIAVGLY